VTADGIVTINDMIDTSVTQLIASLPGTFLVVGDHTAKTITIQDASYFTPDIGGGAATSYKDTNGIDHPLKVVIIQTFTATLSSAGGQSQITRTTLTDETTYPGSTYAMTLTGSDGTAHTVEYVSHSYDSSSQILQGLLLAAEAAGVTDTFWTTVQFAFDPSALTLDASVRDVFSTTHLVTRPGSAWWELVPFPRELAEQVMRGAYADLLKEWGQTDKGMVEEGAVSQEQGITEGKFTTMPTPQLTGQEAALSRYRIQ
jgi:hypothetical protein